MFYKFFLAVIASLLATLLSANSEPKKVTLQLSWFDQFQFAGYYIAKEKGFYAKEGLDVTILPFSFGLDIPKDVVDQKVDFAVGRETLIIDKAKGLDIVALYALFQASPLVFLSLEDSGILSVKNFANKKVMATIDDASEVSLKAMLNSHGVERDDYTFVKHSHNVNDLIEKRVDVISAYTSKAPFELQEKGIKYTIHSPTYYGFDMYSDFLYTSEKLINKDITTVTAFKRASLKGWEYAYAHVEEAVDLILKKYNSQHLSKAALIFEGKELQRLSYYQTNTLGDIQKSKLQRIHDLYNVMGFIPQSVDLNDFIFGGFGFLKPEQKAYLASKKEIKVCASVDYLPFEGVIDGKHTGLLHTYLANISEGLKVPFSLVSSKSLAQSKESFLAGKCDILSLATKSVTNNEPYVTTSAYIDVPLVVVSANDEIFIPDLDSVSDKKIGILKGLGVTQALQKQHPSIELVEVENSLDGLTKVYKKELYGFIDTLPSVSYQIQKHYPNALKVAGKVENEISFGLGVLKSDTNLLGILENSIENFDTKLKSNILTDWINVKYENGFDYALFWKFTAVVAFVFLIFYFRYRVVQNYNRKIAKNLEIIDKYILFTKTDLRGVITEASDALCTLTGFSRYELLGQPQSIFRHPDAPKEIFKEMWETIQSGKDWEGEFPNLRKDGTSYWVHAKITPIFNAAGEIEGYSAFRTDITDKKRIEELSITDQLTQISNRLFLDRMYEKEINKAKRYGTNLSIILVDVDFFKEVNDQYGHQIGDTVLVKIANVLQINIRESDCVGRWGGEEFLIICPQTTKAQAIFLAEKLKEKMHETIFEEVGQKTCSFGVASFEKDERGFELLNRADKALYQAKSAGRDRVIDL